LKLLEAAATAWDRAEDARQVINTKGATFVDRHGEPRPRPEIQIEKNSHVLFARLVRELKLDQEPAPDFRPPGLNGGRPHRG
jgi:hypothetical protein